jgi:hypothetical protein
MSAAVVFMPGKDGALPHTKDAGVHPVAATRYERASQRLRTIPEGLIIKTAGARVGVERRVGLRGVRNVLGRHLYRSGRGARPGPQAGGLPKAGMASLRSFGDAWTGPVPRDSLHPRVATAQLRPCG